VCELIRRHESLRTRFAVHEGVPYQLIDPPGERYELQQWDLSELAPSPQGQQAEQLIRQEKLRRFDLERGPLFRAGVIKLSEQAHVVVLTMHHIVSDGWSMGVLMRELNLLY